MKTLTFMQKQLRTALIYANGRRDGYRFRKMIEKNMKQKEEENNNEIYGKQKPYS